MRVPMRSLARRLQDVGTRLSPKWSFPWERVPRAAFPVYPIREIAEQGPEAGPPSQPCCQTAVCLKGAAAGLHFVCD